MCKHKLALIKGDPKMLYDPSEETQLQQVLASPAYPALKKRLEEFECETTDIEMEIAKLKQREKKLKADFAHELTHRTRKT